MHISHGTDITGVDLGGDRRRVLEHYPSARDGTRRRIYCRLSLDWRSWKRWPPWPSSCQYFLWLLAGHLPRTFLRRGGLASGPMECFTWVAFWRLCCGVWKSTVRRASAATGPPSLPAPTPSLWPGGCWHGAGDVDGPPATVPPWAGIPRGVEPPALESRRRRWPWRRLLLAGNRSAGARPCPHLAPYLMINTGPGCAAGSDPLPRPDLPLFATWRSLGFDLRFLSRRHPCGRWWVLPIQSASSVTIGSPCYFLVQLVTLPVIRMLGAPATTVSGFSYDFFSFWPR